MLQNIIFAIRNPEIIRNLREAQRDAKFTAQFATS